MQVVIETDVSHPVLVQAAVYTADGSGNPQNLVGISAIQYVNTNTTAAWVTFNIPGNPPLTGGVNYCLCFCQVAAPSGGSAAFGLGTGGTNYGIASLGGSDLSSTPTGARLHPNYLDIKADYCP